MITFINQQLPQTQKIHLCFTQVDTSLRNSLRFSQLVENSSTKLDYVDHGTVIFDTPTDFYLFSTKCPSSGVTVATKYSVVIDEVTTRDDIYAC